MSKKNKKAPRVINNAEQTKATEENAELATTELKTDKSTKVVEVKAKDVAKNKAKKEKVKKPSKIKAALKSTGNELKKVSWPKFKDVVKQTGIVLVVVLVFALVLLGLDKLCSWLVGFLF